MIRLNGNDYRLALLDTNALSELALTPGAFERFESWSEAQPPFVPSFSLFSILELRRRPAAYSRFKDVFSTYPCLLMKSHEQLLAAEVDCYPDHGSVEPALLGFSPIGGEGMNLQTVLDLAFQDEANLESEEYWNAGIEPIVEGIGSLVANYPPSGAKYSRSEVRHFIELTCLSQLAMRQSQFMRHRVAVEEEPIDVDAFPSVKSTSFAVWHKFYADRDRKPTNSDAFDIVISAAIPYVDAVVTEAHLADSLRKTKRIDRFIEHVEVLTLRDFRPD